MSVGTIIWIIAAILVLCCAFTHRRIIRAGVKHEPMPKAPKGHVLDVKGQLEKPSAAMEYDATRLENQLCLPLYACAKEIVRQYCRPLEPLGLPIRSTS